MSERLFGQRPAETPYERGYVDGEQFAEQRIIKLLDAEFDRVYPLKDYPASNAIMNVKARLIKGETE